MRNGGDFVTLAGIPDGAPHASRIGRPHKLPVCRSQLASVICARTRYGGHAGVLEAQAVKLAIEWFARSAANLSHRLALLVDAKAVLGAVGKGRSSSRLLRRITARICSLLLATDITLHLVYIPSEWNPADFPSRGRSLPSRSPRRVKRHIHKGSM